MTTMTIEKTDFIDPQTQQKMNYVTVTDTQTDTLQIVTGSDHDYISVTQVTGSVCINTGSGNDKIHVFNVSGDLEVYAGPGNDSVYVYLPVGGYCGVYGENGDDFLGGSIGNDNLYGGEGNDTIIGSGGNDILEGGNNTGLFKYTAQDGITVMRGDHLWGGYGLDNSYDNETNIFIFRNGNGVQVIHDFQAGLDILEIHGHAPQQAHYIYENDNTFIKLSETSGIWLLNVHLLGEDINWVSPRLHADSLSPEAIVELEDASYQSLYVSGEFFAYEFDSGDPFVDNNLAITRIGCPVVRLDGMPLSSPEVVSVLSESTALIFNELTSYAKAMKVSYEYNVPDVNLDFLAEGQELTINYKLAVNNYMAYSTIQELTITIIGTNDIPIISGTDTGYVVEDNEPNAITQVSGALSITDLDAGQSSFQLPMHAFDSQNECTYTLRAVTSFDTALTIFDNDSFKENIMPNMISKADLAESTEVLGSYGTFTFDTEGNWTYTLDNSVGSATDQLVDGEIVHDTLTVLSFDGSVFKTIDITVVGTNDLPVIGGDQTGSIVEGDGVTPNSTSGVLTIADPDAGESSFVVISNLIADYGIFTFNEATGEWTYTVNDTAGSAVDRLAEGEVIFDQLIVNSFDGSTPTIIEVSITGTNDLPVIDGIATGAVTEDNNPEAVTTTGGFLTIADPDNGESSFLVPENLEGTYGTFSFSENGVWGYTLNNTPGSATDQLGEGVEAHDTLTVVSFDGTTSTVLDVTVTGVNDEPVIEGDEFALVTEDNAEGAITTAFGTLSIVDPDEGESSFLLPGEPILLNEVFADQGMTPSVNDSYYATDFCSPLSVFDLGVNETVVF